jgi:threonylcarbamoyladenosine tRNA methylthiotransferase MtaB
LNLGELDALARSLARRGHTVVGPGESAEICILNTCTVTGAAAKKSRQALRRLRRALPEASLVVTGCFAELAADTCEDLGADLVVPNVHKDQLEGILKERGILRPATDPGPPSTVPASAHTRAFLKVQDGCNNHCTFCIVTRARGESRSRKIADILEDILRLEDEGFR